MRLTELKGFVITSIVDGEVFQRGKMHKIPYERKKAAFLHYGITIIYALAGKADPDLQRMHDEDFIDYVYNPIPDGILHEDVREKLCEFADEAVDELEHGGAILAHCNAGRNRSGLLNAMIVYRLFDMTGAEALELVREERPRAVDNDYFEEYLRGLK